MTPTTTRRLAAIPFFGLAAALVACGAPDRSPTGLTNVTRVSRSNTTTTPGWVEACKWSGAAGTYTFRVSVTGAGHYTLPAGTEASVNFDGSTPACVLMYSPVNDASWGAGVTNQVTIREINLAADQTVLSVLVADFNTATIVEIVGQDYATVTVDLTSMYKIKFNNGYKPPQNGGGQGCTPGYWKAKPHHDSWPATGYSTTQLLSTVFTIPAGYAVKGVPMGNYGMLAGLSFQGGSTISGKAEILLRAAIAALLNSAHGSVDYAMSTAAITSAVNAALAGGDSGVIITLATQLDIYNNGGCPIN